MNFAVLIFVACCLYSVSAGVYERDPKNWVKATYKGVSFDVPTTNDKNHRSDLELLRSLQTSVDKINSFVEDRGEEAYENLREKFDEKNSKDGLNAGCANNELTDLIIQAIELLKKEGMAEDDRATLKQLNRSFYVINQLIDDYEKNN